MSGTYGSQRAHRIHRRSHPPCRTSTRRGYTHQCHSGTVGAEEKKEKNKATADDLT